jgi:hypothetical protein
MEFPGHISPLDARDRKRYPVEIANIPERGAAPAPQRARLLSFPEVAAHAVPERMDDAARSSNTAAAKPNKPFTLWERDAFAFGDFVDIINPLQHIPIIATIYRNLTDDKIGAAPRIIGGALWGRIGGLAGGLVNAVLDWFTGKDVGDHVYAAFFGTPGQAASGTSVARATRAPSGSPLTGRGSQSVATQTSAETGADAETRAERQQLPAGSERSAPLSPRTAASSAPFLLNTYLPEKRWDTEDGDDRRVRFTA